MLPLLRHFGAVLQLMRWKLVITAVADGQCALLLAARAGAVQWDLIAALAVALMSMGLYAGGMTLNDLVDWRRDSFLHPAKPIPAGRISLPAARLWCLAWFALGIVAGIAVAISTGHSIVSAFFLAWTVLLIFFYNFVGKFLGSSGIVSLGLIRFFHAAIAQPLLWVLMHPLLLLNHVAAITAVCYVLENKRPRLSRVQRWFVISALALLNLFILSGVVLATLVRHSFAELPQRLGLQWGLLLPMLLAVLFWLAVLRLMRRLPPRPAEMAAEPAEVAAHPAVAEPVGAAAVHREWLQHRQRVGRRLMFAGLLWLVLYDAAFVLGFL
jgi:4-hydroxybenzoate polyprenyltransferase